MKPIPFIKKIQTRKSKLENRIELGGEQVEIKPLPLEAALSLIVLLAPHLALLESHWGEFRRILETTDGRRPQLLSALFVALRGEMSQFPGDMVRAMAILLDKDIEWIATRCTAQDFIRVLPLLDRANNFRLLWESAKALGLVVKYGG